MFDARDMRLFCVRLQEKLLEKANRELVWDWEYQRGLLAQRDPMDNFDQGVRDGVTIFARQLLKDFFDCEMKCPGDRNIYED